MIPAQRRRVDISVTRLHLPLWAGDVADWRPQGRCDGTPRVREGMRIRPGARTRPDGQVAARDNKDSVAVHPPLMKEAPDDLVCRASVSQNNTSEPRRGPVRPRARARRGGRTRGVLGKRDLVAPFGQNGYSTPRFEVRTVYRSAGRGIRSARKKGASPFSARQRCGFMLTCRLRARVYDPSFRKRSRHAREPPAPPMAGLIHTKAGDGGRFCDLRRRPFFTRARRPSHCPSDAFLACALEQHSG